MDPSLIVGYLVARLVGSATSFANQKVDDLLGRLFERVWQRLGGDPSLKRLAAEPENGAAQEWASARIAEASAADPALGEELMRLAGELRSIAPDLLVYAPNAETVVGVNSGYLIQGGNVVIHHHDAARSSQALRSAAPGVKLLAIASMLLIVSGLGTGFYAVLIDVPRRVHEPFSGFPKSGILAFGLFFAGFVLGAIVSAVLGLQPHPRPKGARR